ncbi:MAG: polysaccharide deacetylase family protein [Marinilabilia sp.]
MKAITVAGSPDEVPPGTRNRIIFVLTSANEPTPVHIRFDGENLPILFSNDPHSAELFRMDENKNLWFSHDLLSSAFYVLSGQQETMTRIRDRYDRFPYAASFQKELHCISLPVVNYYFEIILRGLEHYAGMQGLKMERKPLFETFGFILGHDVDRIAYHHIFEVLHKVKQFLGLSPKHYSRKMLFNLILRGVFFHLNPFRKNDPWWNFDRIMEAEKQLGIKSAYYFLKNEDRKKDSRYSFNKKRIRDLISKLKENDFEVALHGTFQSYTNQQSLHFQKEELSAITGEAPAGIRQHFLRFSIPETFRIQAAEGFLYDASLGFAEHEGYRNGYCHPFRPFDHERNEMINIWEIPLIMMEMSVLDYRKTSYEELKTSAYKLIKQSKKFGGIFSMLWHNCRINEVETPGITEFYNTLLESIIEENPSLIRPDQLAGTMEQKSAENKDL